MFDLKTPVSAIPKIGPKYKGLLEKLDITNVESLIFHIPFRYDDFSEVKNIKDIQIDETVTIRGTLGPVQNIFTKYGKRITKATIFDATGTVSIIWFNAHYLKKVLNSGAIYTVSGKVSVFDRKPCFISPECEEYKEESVNTGRLVPVYPETAGVTSKWLRARINDVLPRVSGLDEFLPHELIKQNNLRDFKWSIENIHFPENKISAEQAKRRLAFNELFIELLKVESRKNTWKDKSFGIEMEMSPAHLKGKSTKLGLSDFVNTLPFKLTDSQITAVDDIIKDMQKDRPMNRLLEGDVGTGKTVVAVIASYFANINGYKTLYLAPTELLAQQHFKTFKTLLNKIEINIELQTSSVKSKSNDWDILIGTHALLFKEDTYEKIGLIVIDEQHRFGVEQRGKIIEMAKQGLNSTKDKNVIPHVLTMTATPIPRTLALTLYGDLDISALKTHPNTERKITTKVVPEKNREDIYKWILQRNEQAFIVCPLIEESESESLENVKSAEEEYEKLKETYFKNVSVGLIHGRMKPTEKQQIISDFRDGKIQILVATPVIEVGIDIPDAAIMVIESAERYGLASLHQLRGRVGRGKKEGFCFIFMSNFSRNSYERLKYLEEINNGLELAEIDLKLRGQGDIFSTMQSGFKKFKVAGFDDLVLMEEAKIAAQKYFPVLDNYPQLYEAVKRTLGDFIKNN